MVFAVYLLENAIWCCPGVGHLHPILISTVGFCINAKPHQRAFTAFQNKMTNAQQMSGGIGID